MASLPKVIGARSAYRTLFPIQGVQTLQKSGRLPVLDQKQAPAGFDLSYDLRTIGPQASAADAVKKIEQLGTLPVTLVREPQRSTLLESVLGVFSDVASFWFSPWSTGAQVGLSAVKGQATVGDPTVGAVSLAPVTTQGGPMFQDGDSWSFDSVFSGVNQALQQYGGQLLDIGGNALTGYLSSLNQPGRSLPVSAPAMTTMAAVPAIAGAGRAVATVGRGFFNRFPNLATAIQSLRNRGANVSRSTLYSAMRRFGPEMLVSGGLLTAAAVSELAVAGPGRRRMNPGNVKALRRAHRRMKSFHHLCSQNDVLRRRSRK